MMHSRMAMLFLLMSDFMLMNAFIYRLSVAGLGSHFFGYGTGCPGCLFGKEFFQERMIERMA